MTCRVCTDSRARAQKEPLTSGELAGGKPLGTWWQECCEQKLLCCRRQTDLRSSLETVSQHFFRRNYRSSGRPRPLGAGGKSPPGPWPGEPLLFSRLCRAGCPRPGHSSPSGAAGPGALTRPFVSELREVHVLPHRRLVRKFTALRGSIWRQTGALCRDPAGAGGSQCVRPRASRSYFHFVG